MPAEGNLEQDEKKRGRNILLRRTRTNTFAARVVTEQIAATKHIDQMSTFRRRKHFPHFFSSKIFDVIRLRRTSIANACEQPQNEHWNEESEDTLSEEWTLNDRMPDLEDHVPRRIHGKWTTHKRPDGPTRSGPKHGPDCQTKERGDHFSRRHRLPRGIFRVCEQLVRCVVSGEICSSGKLEATMYQ